MKEIRLVGKYSNLVTLVDDIVYESLINITLRGKESHGNIYALISKSNDIYRNSEALHRIIFRIYGINIPKNKVVDHINGNTLDNRFSNLRLIDNGLNRRNSKSKNQYRGVSYHSRDNVYELNFQYRNKNYYIGRDDNPYILAQLYDYLCHLLMDKGQFNFEVLDDLSELLGKSKPNTVKKFNYVKQLILENENK